MQFNVFIGRFQPVHNAHLEIIRGALYAEYSKEIYPDDANPNRVIIVLGSAYQSRSPKNPFTWEERESMIRSAFTGDENARMFIVPVSDSMYDDTEWAMAVQGAVDGIVDRCDDARGNVVRLVGHKKDDSSFYLDMFPQWKFIGISNIDDLHSTTIRDYYLNERWDDDAVDIFEEMCKPHLKYSVYKWMDEFRGTEEFRNLKEEHTFIERYKSAWSDSPYPPVFVTVDGVVIQSGHILLIQRGGNPGKGLWALPGGFIDQNERLEDAVLRELREETRLKVPEPVLRGSIKRSHVFDSPDRSQRGRTITHAFHIELNPGPLPKVVGSDDAAKAKWFPLQEVLTTMLDQMYEDHASIIKYFV